MALKGLTKSAQESKSTDQKIEDFISGSTKRIKNLECSQQVYRRFTFSLTEEVSKEIDDLLKQKKLEEEGLIDIIDMGSELNKNNSLRNADKTIWN